MDHRSAAKGVTGSAPGRAVIDVLGNLRPSPVAVGPRRPTYGARPFDGTTGGGGDTRDPPGGRWLGSRGPATPAERRRATPPAARPRSPPRAPAAFAPPPRWGA